MEMFGGPDNILGAPLRCPCPARCFYGEPGADGEFPVARVDPSSEAHCVFRNKSARAIANLHLGHHV
eukprot:15182219-Alexandrium_andersonii.AAC.1